MDRVVSSRKEPQDAEEALRTARRHARLVSYRGTSVREIDMRKGPAREEVLALLLGPSGKLRAPAYSAGDTLHVGFPREGGPQLG